MRKPIVKLKAMDSQFAERQWRNLKTVIRKPTSIKIDTHLEKHGQLYYVYDYSDDWRMVVRLEMIVDDYYFGYPNLLDGAETASPLLK